MKFWGEYLSNLELGSCYVLRWPQKIPRYIYFQIEQSFIPLEDMRRGDLLWQDYCLLQFKPFPSKWNTSRISLRLIWKISIGTSTWDKAKGEDKNRDAFFGNKLQLALSKIFSP